MHTDHETTVIIGIYASGQAKPYIQQKFSMSILPSGLIREQNSVIESLNDRTGLGWKGP